MHDLKNVDENEYIPSFFDDEDPFSNCKDEKVYIHEDIEMMWEDICNLHTELTDGTPGEHCVEIRPIMRKANLKGKHDVAIKNFHLWKADTETKERFKEWIKSDVRNQGCCLYVSVYCFDATLKCFKENGTSYRPYTINKHNQLYSRVMVVDLDHINEDENNKFDLTMEKLGIPFQSVQTSQDGYQKRFYLTDQVEDAYALSIFAKILINKGFKVDPKVINRGQVVRLLGSINNKVFSPKFRRSSQFPVKLLKDSNNKIPFRELIEKINSLPDSKYFKYNLDTVRLQEAVEIKKENYKPIAYYREEFFIKYYKDIIPEHYFKIIQKPIRFMLSDTEAEGYTDDVVMFIIPYFKNTLKMSFEQVKPIMDKWAELNNYLELDKYERIYYTEYKKGFGVYTTRLQERYGSISFHKNYDTIIKINDNTVNLKPIIFTDTIYPKFDKTALKVFIGFMFEYKASNKITWTLSQVMEFNNISKPTAIKALKHLIEYNCISCKTYYKGSGKENDYTLKKTYIALKTERRIEFTLTQLREMNRDLKGNEIKVFIYMRYMILKCSEGSYYGNQTDIAKAVGLTQQAVSTVLKALNKKRFINIKKVKINNITDSSEYTLLI
ncbi:hypothetical protein HBF21_15715 [Clostridium perfringens]|uniref:hypothetical protein n=3 Tax=Clostridium perfringens TaxID=1502 RepID=UPI0013E37A88|nr:hypothetical protein [Clostridium perfringens]MBI6025086.1 hypothetical protein [Clostridium perfringens]MBI6048940.1 hypothetical protein [Clostridium perfringens]MDJ8927806.1 hypothetical protein [Clostridium perfringens]MDJ8930703.1 hypothetical protein [Clostridium perfringens]MDJ8936476.1 hypothetical protein [Clostridium perfringens]